jgi:hypothetical protein
MINPSRVVMPRLGLGIHELLRATGKKLVDPRANPWDDEPVWDNRSAR